MFRRPETDDYLQQKLEGAEPIGWAVTNDVYRTGDGTVIKQFTFRPLNTVIFSLMGVLLGRRELLNWRKRRDRDVEIKRLLNQEGFEVPELVYKGGAAIELEEVEQQTVLDWMADDGTPRMAGELVGDFLQDLHDSQISLLDNGLENFLILDEEVCSVDHEYGSCSASAREKSFGVANLSLTCLLCPPPIEEVSGRVSRRPIGR